MQPNTRVTTDFWKAPRSSQALAQQWARRTRSGNQAFLIQEIQARMLERAALIRMVPGLIVDQSFSLPGHSLAPTQLLSPAGSAAANPIQVCQIGPVLTQSESIALVKPLSLVATVKAKLLDSMVRKPRILATYSGLPPGQPTLPLADASAALVWSNMWLHRVADPRLLIKEWARVLMPGGALFFSCFGPDTAHQLMRALLQLGQAGPDYADMHDIGDTLVHAGFSDPVMEMEKLTLTYATPKALLDDWRTTESNHLVGRHPALRGRGYLAALEAALETQRDAASGRILLTLELVYGHAWRLAKKPPADAVISVESIGGRRRPAP